MGFAEEVRQQEKELGFQFDYIVVCSVTGSTQAGMVVGFAADGRARKVIGIDASAKPEKTHAQILRIAQNTAKLVELGQEITAEDVVLDTPTAALNTACPMKERSKPFACARGKRACSRTRCTKASPCTA